MVRLRIFEYDFSFNSVRQEDDSFFAQVRSLNIALLNDFVVHFVKRWATVELTVT
jgi:hypothetical protein